MSRDEACILYVYPRFNDARDPTAGGAENRTSHLLEEASKSFDVTLLQAEPDSQFQSERSYENMFFRAVTPAFLTDLNPFYWLALFRLLRSEDYDIVQVESLGGILVALCFVGLLCPDTIVIYGSHNVEVERVESALNPELPFYKRIGAPVVIPLLEGAAVRRSDAVIAVSDRDAKAFCERYSVPNSKLYTIRSGTTTVDLDGLKDRSAVREHHSLTEDEIALVFHGTYENYANREALDEIRTNILPALRDFDEPITVFVAGSGMPEFDDDAISSVGFVPDLDSFLNAMDIAIVPLKSGGGTKLKIFDYMAVGLPIVSTRKATEGIDIDERTDAIVVDEVNKQFKNAIIEIIQDPQLRESLSEHAYSRATSEYSWEGIGEQLRGTYKILSDSGLS